MAAAFLHGYLLCLGLILPLGVQNVYIFNRGAQCRRWLEALPAVLTAAVCDSLLILAAIGGVSLIILKIPALHYLLAGAGVIFLGYMGVVTWRTAPGPEAASAAGQSLGRQILFAASVSLLNPHAIMDTIGVIGPSSLAYRATFVYAFGAGCILNSWLWFFGLMITGHLIGSLPKADRFLRMMNRISAVIIWACAALLVFSLWRQR